MIEQTHKENIMTSAEFLKKFIDECVAEGKSSPAAMLSKAQEEIKALELEIKKIEELRIKQSNLQQIIRQFGVTERKSKKNPMVTDTSKENLDTGLTKICIRICEVIQEKSPGMLSPHQIRDEVCSLTDHKSAYAAIKSLWDHGIIQRIEKDNKILIYKGQKWEERPKTISESDN